MPRLSRVDRQTRQQPALNTTIVWIPSVSFPLENPPLVSIVYPDFRLAKPTEPSKIIRAILIQRSVKWVPSVLSYTTSYHKLLFLLSSFFSILLHLSVVRNSNPNTIPVLFSFTFVLCHPKSNLDVSSSCLLSEDQLQFILFHLPSDFEIQIA